jgi:hypothetical protein
MYVPYFLAFSGLTDFKNLYFYNAMCNKGSVSHGLDQGKTCNEQGNDELRHVIPYPDPVWAELEIINYLFDLM